MSKSKKRVLGKGLGALLANAETDITSGKNSAAVTDVVGSISSIPIENIETNPFQPRTKFEKEALAELALSIKELGIIQPITVRKLGYDQFQLISGERRFRASQIAGLKEVPSYIRIANDQAMLEMAIVENVQRENLDAIEIALSYQRLIEECSLTQEELGKKIAKSRTAITNHLRLLKLPTEIQAGLRSREITMGHARALLSVSNPTDQLVAYAKVIHDQLSVRDTETLVKLINSSDVKSEDELKQTTKIKLSSEQKKIKDQLVRFLDTKVDIKKSTKGTGKILIDFASDNDLKRIIELLRQS